MLFDVLWEEAWKITGLPNIAKSEIPKSLSNITKRKLMNYSTEEVASFITESVEEINSGSVKTIDALVDELINKEKR